MYGGLAMNEQYIELSITGSGWAMVCCVSGCKNWVIRYDPGNPAGAVLAALSHVRDHHWSTTLTLKCNHRDIVEAVISNNNPYDEEALRNAVMLYRSLSHCTLKYVHSSEIKEAERLSSLVPHLKL